MPEEKDAHPLCSRQNMLERQINNMFHCVNVKNSCWVGVHRDPKLQIGCKNQVMIRVGTDGDKRGLIEKEMEPL